MGECGCEGQEVTVAGRSPKPLPDRSMGGGVNHQRRVRPWQDMPGLSLLPADNSTQTRRSVSRAASSSSAPGDIGLPTHSAGRPVGPPHAGTALNGPSSSRNGWQILGAERNGLRDDTRRDRTPRGRSFEPCSSSNRPQPDCDLQDDLVDLRRDMFARGGSLSLAPWSNYTEKYRSFFDSLWPAASAFGIGQRDLLRLDYGSDWRGRLRSFPISKAYVDRNLPDSGRSRLRTTEARFLNLCREFRPELGARFRSLTFRDVRSMVSSHPNRRTASGLFFVDMDVMEGAATLASLVAASIPDYFDEVFFRRMEGCDVAAMASFGPSGPFRIQVEPHEAHRIKDTVRVVTRGGYRNCAVSTPILTYDGDSFLVNSQPGTGLAGDPSTDVFYDGDLLDGGRSLASANYAGGGLIRLCPTVVAQLCYAVDVHLWCASILLDFARDTTSADDSEQARLTAEAAFVMAMGFVVDIAGFVMHEVAHARDVCGSGHGIRGSGAPLSCGHDLVKVIVLTRFRSVFRLGRWEARPNRGGARVSPLRTDFEVMLEVSNNRFGSDACACDLVGSNNDFLEFLERLDVAPRRVAEVNQIIDDLPSNSVARAALITQALAPSYTFFDLISGESLSEEVVTAPTFPANVRRYVRSSCGDGVHAVRIQAWSAGTGVTYLSWGLNPFAFGSRNRDCARGRAIIYHEQDRRPRIDCLGWST